MPSPFPSATIPVKPFTASHSQESVDALKQLLALSPLGPKTFENTHSDHTDPLSRRPDKQVEQDSERYYGVSHEWMTKTKQSWLTYLDGWKSTHEKELNEYPMFVAKVDIDDGLSLDVHFVAVTSDHKDATNVCILHGWPGWYGEMTPLIPELQKAASGRPLNIIIPSLIGYTYSGSAPTDREFTFKEHAEIMDRLMVGLGYGKENGGGYYCQGGDLGSFMSRHMAVRFEDCRGAHRKLASRLPIAFIEVLVVSQLLPTRQTTSGRRRLDALII